MQVRSERGPLSRQRLARRQPERRCEARSQQGNRESPSPEAGAAAHVERAPRVGEEEPWRGAGGESLGGDGVGGVGTRQVTVALVDFILWEVLC